MRAMELKSRWRAPLAALGAGAMLFTIGCGANAAPGVTGTPAQLTSSQAGMPVLVSCEPHQRTLVRQAVVNGAVVSQVECVAVGQTAAYAPGAVTAAQPVYNAYPARVAQPVYSDIGDAQIVPVAAPTRTVARPVRTRQVVYDERPSSTRTKTKSAIIIGSSAGVGAGVGAAVGGKKGALIGAAIGGGGAAIWDQVTRRK